MKLAVFTPLPPVRSGIAHYNSMLLPELANRHDVTAVVEQQNWEKPSGTAVVLHTEFDRAGFDRVIYHLGNNPYHRFAYEAAMKQPGVVVLHDFVLHHLIVEATLAAGNADGYIEELRRNHGAGGEALARGRKAGFHGEIGNFLYPASAEVCRGSEMVIVHNRYAGESLRRYGVSVPIVIVGHPFRPSRRIHDRESLRRQLGYEKDDVVVGLFGFLTAAKRPEVVFEAFSRAREANPRLRMLIVGEPAPNVDARALAERFRLDPESWKALGYVADDEFDAYLAAVDKVVNLRYPSAGETSGALIRVFAAGKPVAVSDYAQFAEFPGEVATKIPFGNEEVGKLAQFLTEPAPSTAENQRQWLDRHATLRGAVDGYTRALAGENDLPPGLPWNVPAIPVLANLRADRFNASRSGEHWHVSFVLTNAGQTRLNAGVYGAPGYRLLAKVLSGAGVIADRWLPLPRDLAPGATSTIDLDFASTETPLRLELSHGIQGVPHFDFAPFASTELRG